MNAIHFLAARPWVERLGEVLLHFLWQGAAVALLYAWVRRIARTARPESRYAIACLALVLMAAAPAATWSLLRPAPVESVAATFAAPLSSATPVSPVPGSTAVIHATAPVLPWVVVVWMAGATALWLRLLGGWMVALRLRSQLVRPAPPEWQEALDRLRSQLRVSPPVRLLVSALAETPVVVGWIRPVVLVPAGALLGIPAVQMEALLLHELAHIRRHDYLVNLLQNAVEALLFYHPAVWWISGHIRAERELCCDDAAVSITGDAMSYARALAALQPAQPAVPTAAVAANGGALVHRIARLVGAPQSSAHTGSGSAIGAVAVLFACGALLLAQSATRPAFAVASVKPSTEQRFQRVRPVPGGLNADASLKMLIQNAYALQPYQIVGGPSWIESDHYQIDAKADGGATRDQILLMLQSLLEERFQLKVHRETRELPAYALAPAKGGLKLPAPKAGNCADGPSADASQGSGGRMPSPGQGAATPAPPCGDVRIALAMTGAKMEGGKVSMQELVRMLSMALDHPVIDRTGFTGLFDLQLTFLPDETTAAMPAPPPGAMPPAEDRPPFILSAVQEQLGLKLEATRGPVQVLVIDRAERPSAN